jgi:type IV secretion system protein TrbD
VSLRRTPFFRVLHRPRLFLGGEREPTLMMAIVAAGLAVSGQNLVTLIVAAILWFGCIGIFRQVAKADPQMSRVYLRQLKYRGYYPPRSRPYRDAERSSRPFYAATCAAVVALLYWML